VGIELGCAVRQLAIVTALAEVTARQLRRDRAVDAVNQRHERLIEFRILRDEPARRTQPRVERCDDTARRDGGVDRWLSETFAHVGPVVVDRW
jgi:hypothetical protein